MPRGDLDITQWLSWFLTCLDAAIDGATTTLGKVLDKQDFWDRLATQPFNPRQRDMLNRLLDGFEGKLTTSKWAVLTRTSQDTALRDIEDLITRDILMRNAAGGRSTSYSLVPGFSPKPGRPR